MNFANSIKLQLQRNLEDMKPGKKQFPVRNLHYNSSISPDQHMLQTESKPRIGHRSLKEDKSPNNYSLLIEIERLKKQLDYQNKEIVRLSNDMKQKSEGVIRSVSYQRKPERTGNNHPYFPKGKPNIMNRYDAKYGNSMAYGVDSNTPKLADKNVYFTKRTPKPLTDDPITGLPRSTGNSPFRGVGAAVSRSRKTVRPFF